MKMERKIPIKSFSYIKQDSKMKIGNAKERFGKKSKAVEKAKEMCSQYRRRGKGCVFLC